MSEKIPKGWKWVKLGDAVIINPNETLKKGIIAKKVPMEALHPFTKKVKFFVFEKYNGGVKFKNGDTLVARITPSLENGKTVYVDLLDDDEIGFGSTEFIVLREKSGITDKQFVYYFAISNDFRDVAIKSMTGSSGRQRVQNEVVKEFEFPLPPLPEQKAIAEVLSSIDDKIDLLHRQNKTLEKIAMTLFKQWFIEPTKDGLPEGWEERGLGEIFDYLEGPGIRNWQYSTRGIPFLNIRLIENGEINIKNANFISEEEAFGKYKKFLLQEGDVVISTSGTLGKYAIVRKYHLPLLLNTSIIRFRPKNKNYRIFMYLYLKSREFKEYLESSADGSVQANFGPTHLRAIKIIVPPSHALEKFEKIISPLYEKFDNNFFQIKSLEKLRDTLLPKLMSGEVRVRF